MKIENWGVISYSEAWKRQTELFNGLIEAKKRGEEYINRIICCEHEPVYTLGKSGKMNNLLIREEELRGLGATFFQIDRGGDITYHGPGQLVVYPILNLEDFHLGLREYIALLEEAVISLCAHYGIEGKRVEGAIGVWIDAGKPTARKICAFGVRCSHFVTMHGLALNVNTDLRFFDYINPCGFVDKGVTSLSKELGSTLDYEEVTQCFISILTSLLKER